MLVIRTARRQRADGIEITAPRHDPQPGQIARHGGNIGEDRVRLLVIGEHQQRDRHRLGPLAPAPSGRPSGRQAHARSVNRRHATDCDPEKGQAEQDCDGDFQHRQPAGLQDRDHFAHRKPGQQQHRREHRNGRERPGPVRCANRRDRIVEPCPETLFRHGEGSVFGKAGHCGADVHRNSHTSETGRIS